MINMFNKKNKGYKLSFSIVLLLSWSSIGWIDPLADKIREGNQLYQDGNYDGALDKYVNAQIDSPKIPQLDFNIADVQYKRGKYNEASQLFEKVIKSDDIGTVFLSDPHRINNYTLFFCFYGCLHGIVLMILAIGNQYDSRMILNLSQRWKYFF